MGWVFASPFPHRKFNTVVVFHFLGGEDYEDVVIDVPLTFGEVRKCIGISVIEDPDIEEDETFYVVLWTLSAHVTILDDGKT